MEMNKGEAFFYSSWSRYNNFDFGLWFFSGKTIFRDAQ